MGPISISVAPPTLSFFFFVQSVTNALESVIGVTTSPHQQWWIFLKNIFCRWITDNTCTPLGTAFGMWLSMQMCYFKHHLYHLCQLIPKCLTSDWLCIYVVLCQYLVPKRSIALSTSKPWRKSREKSRQKISLNRICTWSTETQTLLLHSAARTRLRGSSYRLSLFRPA